ncbi:MAG: FG-GAP repeat protein [Anaerolineae bacterium]|nr:FG-GAP repeat protein [Anaerolineae bacterium]
MKQSRLFWKGIGAWLILVWLVAALAWPGQATSQVQSLQDAEPEWQNNLPPWQPGFPVGLSGGYIYWGSSPTLVDLDGNGALEIVIAGPNLNGNQLGCKGMVYAYRSNGSLMWQTEVRARVNSTPSAADLNGDGHPDVVVAMGGSTDSQCWDGGVTALDGLTGAELNTPPFHWPFDTQDWLNHNPDGWTDGVIATPAIGDVNGDGEIEIAFGAWDQCFYLLNKYGEPLWGNLPGILPGTYCGGHGFYNEDTFWSSPALADLTGDGVPEIITGADIYQGNVWGDPTGGYLYVFDANGNALAREWMDQDVYSSPAAADLDNDGANEIVVGTGLFLAGKGYYVSAYDYNPSGASPVDRLVLKWRKPTVGRVFASPALGDLDKDGWLDVAIAALVGDNGGDGTLLYAWRGHDGAALFQRRVCDMFGNSMGTLASPIIADVDGDTWSEILISHMWEIAILNHDGTYYTDYSNPQYDPPNHAGCQRNHAPTTDVSFWAQYSIYGTPAVGDLDGDGDAEVVIGGQNPGNPKQGMISVWTGQSVDGQPSWPTWHHDVRHTGFLLFDILPPTNPTSLSSPSHTPGAWSTSRQVQAVWSGAADDKSGVAGYSVVWDTAPGTLPDTVVDLPVEVTSATSPALADGKNHYFHLRTADKAGNWTASALHLGPFWIDATPPMSYASSPPLVKGPFLVSWQGADGASGLVDYTIQVRQNGGAWTVWLDHQAAGSATYPGTVGNTYRFRSIARDVAGNTETDYTQQGDTTTVVVGYLLGGSVYDHRGRPVPGAAASSQPAALNQGVADAGGHYTLGLLDTGTYEVSASNPLYGSLPPRYGVVVNGDVEGVDFYLPPASNFIQNGTFEVDGGWQLEGTAPPGRAQGVGYTGAYALEMGVLPTGLADSLGMSWPPLPGALDPWIWAASQEAPVPASGQATLAWVYRVSGLAAPGDSLAVTIEGPSSTITEVLSLDVETWTHGWVDVSGFAGQQVVVRFVLSRESPGGPLYVWVDDVSEGITPFRVCLPALVNR